MLKNFLIVGGASAYAPGLVKALIEESHRHELDVVRLYDIDEERLEIVSRLCQNMAKAADSPFGIEATTSQVEAVQDIDALLNSSRPGGFEGRQIDETLPLEFGIPGQETVGPGGFFFALRSIPAAMDLAADVARHAPEATWLNYTNPTNIVGQALCDETDLDVIALCDQSDEDLRALCDALGYSKEAEYRFRCSGLNHATWYREICIDGEPIDGLLKDRIDDLEAPDYYDAEHKLRFEYSTHMAKTQEGIWPNSYLPYYGYPESFVDLARNQGTRTEAILEGLDAYYDHFRRQGLRDAPDLQHHRGSSGFGDMAADVVAALSSPKKTELVLNIPNRGLNEEFDGATVVEAFATVSDAGVERHSAPPIPLDSLALVRQLETYQRRTATAAISGNFDEMTQALAANPLVDEPSVAEAMLDKARRQYGELLPQFSS